jgi:hypothetical protein
MHPRTVVYLEHDGKLLLVDENGDGLEVRHTQSSMENQKSIGPNIGLGKTKSSPTTLFTQ